MPEKKTRAGYELELQVRYSTLSSEQLKKLKEYFKTRPVTTLPPIDPDDPVKQRVAVKQHPAARPKPRPAAKRPGKARK